MIAHRMKLIIYTRGRNSAFQSYASPPSSGLRMARSRRRACNFSYIEVYMPVAGDADRLPESKGCTSTMCSEEEQCGTRSCDLPNPLSARSTLTLEKLPPQRKLPQRRVADLMNGAYQQDTQQLYQVILLAAASYLWSLYPVKRDNLNARACMAPACLPGCNCNASNRQ